MQLDFVNVLVPAHYQVPFSRLGPYERSRLDDVVYKRREFTERDVQRLVRESARVHELAIENEELRSQRDRNQQARQEPRAVRTSWWSRRIGGRL